MFATLQTTLDDNIYSFGDCAACPLSIDNINFIEVWDEEVRGTQEEYFQAKQIAVANYSIGTGFG